MMTRLALTTKLPPEACLCRLREAISPAPVFLWRMPKEETFYGTVKGGRFRIWVIRPDDPRRNSFMPVLYGTVSPSAEGSTITGVIRRHTAVYLFMALSYAAVLVAGFLIWRLVLSHLPGVVSLFEVLFLLVLVGWSALMLLVPWMVWAVCAAMNRDKEDDLRSFVAKVLETGN